MNYHMTSGLMKFAFWFLTSLGYRAVHTLFALGVMLLVFETIIVPVQKKPLGLVYERAEGCKMFILEDKYMSSSLYMVLQFLRSTVYALGLCKRYI